MIDNDKKLNLTDLIDIKLLQELQDTFAQTMGVASIAVDDNGPITNPSNFTDFCIKYTRGTTEGYKRCNECDIKWGKVAAETGKPVIYYCHSGLRDFAVPIVVEGKHIASILGGQILTEKPNEEHFRSLARELGINEDEYMEAVKKIKIVPIETIDAAANFLYLVANTISKVALKNLELIKKNKREFLYRNITETIRSSLDINRTKQKIVDIVGKTLDADRCFIMEYDKINDEFLIVKDEYVSSDNIPKYEGSDVNKDVPNIMSELKKGKNLVINNKQIFINGNLQIFNIEKETIERVKVDAAYGFPLFYNEELLGVLGVHYIKKHTTNDDEISLLNIVANQIAIAIHQAKLYEKEKETAERERILRDIIGKIRSSLDIEFIKHEIVNQIGIFFNASGVRVADYDYKLEDYVVSKEAEYKSSENIKSWVGIEFKNIPEFTKCIRDVHLRGENIIFSDLEEYLDENNFRGKKIEDFYRDFGFISSAAINIYNADMYIGDFVITFDHPKKISDDEIEFLKTLADQVGTAFYQADLYKNTKQTAEREITLRNIIETIRSTLDINETKITIVNEIGKLLKADRVFLVEFDPENNIPQVLDQYSEYLSSPDIYSLVGYDFSNPEVSFLAAIHKETKPILVQDVEKFIIDNNLHNTEVEKWLQKTEVKSGVGMAIFYGKKVYGVLTIHYTKSIVYITDEQLKFFRTLGDQIGIALYQAELFEKEKKTAEREKLLKDIVVIIRSSLDINEIKRSVVKEIGKAFNADRCYFRYFDKKQDKFLTPDVEYLKSDEISSLINEAPDQESLAYFVEELNKRKKGFYPIVADEEFAKDTPIERYFKAADIKADYAMPILDREDELTYLVLHYTKKDPKLIEEDKKLLETIANQIVIALDQAKLYKRTQLQAKRETLLRKITETIRSSLDIEEVLSFICEETAKLFNVQRSAIVVFPNPENYEDFIVKKEYKSSAEIEGLGYTENYQKIAAYWGNILMESGKVLAFDNIQESETPEYFKNTYGFMGIKSMIGISIRKGKNVWGTLALSEYNNPRHWSDEEKRLLKTIADQIYIAINQAELFETAQKTAENEKTLRSIMLSSVSSFDMEEIIKILVTEAGKLFKADRCFYIEIDYETMTNFPVKKYAEYLSSEDIISHTTRPPSKAETEVFIKQVKEHTVVYASDVSKEDLPEATKKMLIDDLSVKSYLNTPVFYGDICYGAIILHYIHEFKQFSQNEINMALAIANQSAIIIHQAELYEITKVQAEREKISRNIIEILRSTLDKSVIKRLFVKNIGKFFDADRVLFSEFDYKTNMYRPVDKNSEYLSSIDIKSFVGYDWSINEAHDYIQPLLEKREFHIYNWNEYIQGTFRSQDFINLFENLNVKSSYSFPVMYQLKIIGFFSINFTRNVRRLLDEDIHRIRNICSQAGIAFYHSDLYEKAQKSITTHSEFINTLSNELKDPLNMIVEFSKTLPQHELECSEEIEHLNNINNNAKKLIYLLDDIIKNSKTEIDFN